MLKFAIGLFLVLHGLVYLLYVGQSARLFELRSGFEWPDGSLTFARTLGNENARSIASLTFTIVTIGFVAGGVGLLFSQAWWQPMVIASAAAATLVTVLFWDGHFQQLSDKGGIGLLINAAILISLLVLEWPQFSF